MQSQVYLEYPEGLSYVFMYKISSIFAEVDGDYNKVKHYSEADAGDDGDRRIMATSHWPISDQALNISSVTTAKVRI